MKLLIESGATKSNWIVLNGKEKVFSVKLEGINATSNPESLNYISDFKSDYNSQIKNIYFYGAGVSNEFAVNNLQKEFGIFFPSASVDIQHDILAAARSVSHGQKSIVSILGTGTNTVVFDGTEIVFGIKALGHLFSDFGSGYHIGKEVILKFYREEMSDSDMEIFRDKYHAMNPNIHYDIYQLEKPNKIIAHYSRFLNDCSTEFRNEVLDYVFNIFFDRQIESIPDHLDYPLNFVGSIADAFVEKLNEIATRKGMKINKIVADPINGLIDYHRD